MKLLSALILATSISVAHAQAHECEPKFAKIGSLLDEAEKVSVSAEGARELKDIINDMPSRIEYIAVCLKHVPAGAERTKLEKRYMDLQKAAQARLNSSIALFNEAKDLVQEGARLQNKMVRSVDTSVAAEVKAFEAKLAKSKNRYVTAKLREEILEPIHGNLENVNDRAQNAADDAQAKRIQANTVMSRHAGKFTTEDSARPDKIVEAFKLASAKDLVTVRHDDAGDYVPDPADTSSVGPTPPSFGSVKPGEEFGVYSDSNQSGIGLFIKDHRPGAPKGTPALVWEVTKTRAPNTHPNPTIYVMVVTMDGGRFAMSPESLREGLSPAAEWPKTPLNAKSIPDSELYALGKLGLVKSAKSVEAAEKAYEGCTAKLWKQQEAEWERLKVQNITQSTRENRAEAHRTKIVAKINASCAKHEKAFEAAWPKALREYDQVRAKLLGETRAILEKQ